MALDARLRSPKEQPLFILGVIFSSLFWLVLVVTVIGIAYGLVGLGFALVAHALFLVHVKGNGVRVSPRQLGRPGKASTPSGSQTHRGKNQKPCSLDGSQEGNRMS